MSVQTSNNVSTPVLDWERAPRLDEVFRSIMDQQQSCCLVLDEQARVLHVYGATADLLPPPDGLVSNNVLKMVAPSLKVPLSTALDHARNHRGLCHYGTVSLTKSKTTNLTVDLRVAFCPGDGELDNFFTVYLRPESTTTSSISDSPTYHDLNQAMAQRLEVLETELQKSKHQLQVVINELKATNEKQQAKDQEFIAFNKELQNTNEELRQINLEYQEKIQELTQLNNDIDNLLQSTDIGVIFLDRRFCIRKFTQAATHVMALIAADVGRPLTQLAHNLDNVELNCLLYEVLERECTVRREVKLKGEDRYLMLQINPYRVNEQQVDGLVLSLFDITTVKTIQQASQENEALLGSVIDSTPDPIFVKDPSGRYQLTNAAALERLNRPAEEVIGASDLELFPTAIAQKIMVDDQRFLAQSEKNSITYEERIEMSSGEECYFLTTKSIFRDTDGKPLGLVGFARDITSIKQAHADLEVAYQRLQNETARRQNTLVALQESEARFRNTFEQAAVGIAHVALDGHLIRLNQRFADIVGYSKEALQDTTFQRITHPDDLAMDLAFVNQLVAGDLPHYTMVKRYLRKDSSVVWVNLTVALVRTHIGEPSYFIAVVQDINHQKQLEEERDCILQQLFHEKELAQVTLHSIGDAVITTDANARVQYCNPVAETMIGRSMAEAKGKPIDQVVRLVAEDTRATIANPVTEVLSNPEEVFTVENLILVSCNGKEFSVSKSVSPIRDRAGDLIGTVTVFRDTTEAHRLSQQLSWQATHDPLTGLTNRLQFENELAQALANAHNDKRQEHVLCYLDLDRFKIVNDTSGHLAGDELLRQVSMLLEARVRSSDCLARLGGDEFGILLKACPLSRAEVVVDELRMAIQAFRFVWKDKTFSIGVSIGLVAINNDITDLTSAMSAADAACYTAKERGRNRIYVYRADDADIARQRRDREWSARIQNALDNDCFCLYQQPIVSAQLGQSEATVHCEILLRMLGDNGEIIPPNAFIPAAERYNLMPQLDRWVVKNLLTQVAAQPNPTAQSTLYALNLSGSCLSDESFVDFLKVELEKYPEVAPKLCFEIAETDAISNLSEVSRFIQEIQALGCKFSLDDFGNGISSFDCLKALSVDYLKIDGKFMQTIATDSTTRAIVKSINTISHVMGLKTIAEYVENNETLACLKEVDVDFVQGYGIAMPKPF